MTKHHLINDCFLHDKDRLLHAEALQILKSNLNCVCHTETVHLDESLNRILGNDIICQTAVPAQDNSAVDGYAFNHNQYMAGNVPFPIAMRVTAGNPASIPMAIDSCARIFTGAVIPDNADCVAMQEDCEHSADRNAISIPAGLLPGANLRKAGEDLQVGALVLNSGTQLRPQDISQIASLGIASISVRRKPRIALISTGDELVEPGSPLPVGGVYNSNTPLLKSLCHNLNCLVTDLGIIEDNASAVEETIWQAAGTHDVILTSGGASRGEEDHIISTLDKLGHRNMWQLAIKPGRPMTFGQINDTVFLGLPGNPVAAMICFLLYVRPAILQLSGANWHAPQGYLVPAGFSISGKKSDRREFYRGYIAENRNGDMVVEKFQKDGSGLISSLRQADGLIEIPENVTHMEKGELVQFLPFTSFGLQPRL